MLLTDLFNRVMEEVGMKCKIVMQKYKIKDSIYVTMRAIKQFVLLGQGDFIQ